MLNWKIGMSWRILTILVITVITISFSEEAIETTKNKTVVWVFPKDDGLATRYQTSSLANGTSENAKNESANWVFPESNTVNVDKKKPSSEDNTETKNQTESLVDGTHKNRANETVSGQSDKEVNIDSKTNTPADDTSKNSKNVTTSGNNSTLPYDPVDDKFLLKVPEGAACPNGHVLDKDNICRKRFPG